MQIDKFDTWQYRDRHNCWDFVREYLSHNGIDMRYKFDIDPRDKEGMTEASNSIMGEFVDCGPEDFAIACVYRGKYLFHVGVVHNGIVKHVSRKVGLMKHSIEKFERMGRVVYKKWQH